MEESTIDIAISANGHTNGHAAPRRLISREQFLAPKPLTTKRLSLEPFGFEPGTEILIKKLSSREKTALEKSMQRMKGGKQIVEIDDYREKACIVGCINEDGTRLFEESDIATLRNLGADVTSYLADEITKLAQIPQDEVDALTGDFR